MPMEDPPPLKPYTPYHPKSYIRAGSQQGSEGRARQEPKSMRQTPKAWASRQPCSTQRAQYPLIKEYTLNYRGLNIMI